MKKVHMLSSTCQWLSMALAGLLITVVVAGCCTTDPVPSGGKLVPPGIPEGAECTSGEICRNPGNSCYTIFGYRECRNTWNSVTGECKCECI